MSIPTIIFTTLCILTIITVIILSHIVNKAEEKIYNKFFTKEKINFYENNIKSYIGEEYYNKGYYFEELYSKLTNKTIDSDIRYSIRIQEEASIIADKIMEQFMNDELEEAKEEITEYIVTSLIMPYTNIKNKLEKFNFFSNPKSKRIKFVENLADEYHIATIPATKRIKAVLLAENIIKE